MENRNKYTPQYKKPPSTENNLKRFLQDASESSFATKTIKKENSNFLLPLPLAKPLPIAGTSTSFTSRTPAPVASTSPKVTEPKKNDGSDLRIITGTVEVILKILYSSENTIPTLYEVFGKIIKIKPGKYPCEQIILLRYEGPVMGAVFYEIDMKLIGIFEGKRVLSF